MRRRASTCDSWPGERENAATRICLRLRRAAAQGASQASCGCWTPGSPGPALRAVTAARSDGHRAFRRIPRPSVRVQGDLNSRFRENTGGHARAPDLAIDLPHRLAGRARTASGYTRIPRRRHHGSHHGRPCRQFTHARLNTAAPPRRECARRGLDPIPPPNREDRTMTETVDQAQAQPPRALAASSRTPHRSPSSRLAISKDREVAASPHGRSAGWH